MKAIAFTLTALVLGACGTAAPEEAPAEPVEPEPVEQTTTLSEDECFSLQADFDVVMFQLEEVLEPGTDVYDEHVDEADALDVQMEKGGCYR